MLTPSNDYTLLIRQQPKEALVAQDGKGKARKPVDPPPVVQLEVSRGADPLQQFLQSPYLFMCASLEISPDHEQAGYQQSHALLTGSVVSSLHRLKDRAIDQDAGFFIFGDLSVKVTGEHRLKFSLFEIHKDTNEVVFLKSIISDPFMVNLPKDWRGLEESTSLSRSFSDQGVRLRLRKEPRGPAGTKRPRQYGTQLSSEPPAIPSRSQLPHPTYPGDPQYGAPSTKRQRSFEELGGQGYYTDPYRNSVGYESRPNPYQERSRESWGEGSSIQRPLSQGQNPYLGQQNAGWPGYHQGASYPSQANRIDFSFRAPNDTSHLQTGGYTYGDSHALSQPSTSHITSQPQNIPSSRLAWGYDQPSSNPLPFSQQESSLYSQQTQPPSTLDAPSSQPNTYPHQSAVQLPPPHTSGGNPYSQPGFSLATSARDAPTGISSAQQSALSAFDTSQHLPSGLGESAEATKSPSARGSDAYALPPPTPYSEHEPTFDPTLHQQHTAAPYQPAPPGWHENLQHRQA